MAAKMPSEPMDKSVRELPKKARAQPESRAPEVKLTIGLNPPRLTKKMTQRLKEAVGLFNTGKFKVNLFFVVLLSQVLDGFE